MRAERYAGNVGGIEYAKLETAARAHVDDSYYYGAILPQVQALGAALAGETARAPR